MRVYLLVRVLRDACPLWRRRFQIYAGGYARRGGPEINYAGTVRCVCSHCVRLMLAAGTGTTTVRGKSASLPQFWSLERFCLVTASWSASGTMTLRCGLLSIRCGVHLHPAECQQMHHAL